MFRYSPFISPAGIEDCYPPLSPAIQSYPSSVGTPKPMICSAPVGQITMPVRLATEIPFTPSTRGGGFGGPAERPIRGLSTRHSIYYPAVICKGDFQLFFIFFIVSVFAVLWLVLLVMLYVCVIAKIARVFVVMASLYR